jgi:NAD(P)-dependent dehydrogenase (short-subunit alcohol dehydrogenase family)
LFFGGILNQYLKAYKWSNVFAMVRNLSSTPRICPDSFTGRLVIITGATSGIGYAAARKFASRGADLLVVNRNKQKSETLCQTLKNEFGTKSSFIVADFEKLSDIHLAAKELLNLDRDIDVLIHNAGIYNATRVVTPDNLEAVFQTNYLSTFIINYSLKEKFINQGKGRILFVNSEAYRFAAWGLHMDDLSWERHFYTGIGSYGSAKLAQLLSMLKFSKYYSGHGVTINAMHPGNVKTSSGQNNGLIYRFLKKILIDKSAQPVDESSEALYYLGVSKEVENVSGKFFNLTTEEEPAPPAMDMDAAEKLWQISLGLGGYHE